MPLTAQIDSAIPRQNYEVIRDQIGGVLLCEFLNQKINHGLPAEYCPTKVFIEQFLPVDEDQFPYMIVSFDKGKYEEDSKDYSGNVVGAYCYDVDIFTGSASTLEEDGDQLATFALQRIIGITRAILENTIYANLALPDNGIRNVHVGEIYCNPPKKTDNTADVTHGKVKVYVTAPESTPEQSTVTAVLGGTTVHLFNSDKYFFWGVPETQ